MAGISLQIVTPSRRLVETEVAEVYLPGSTGEIGILPEHAPLVSTVIPGIVRFQERGTPRRLAVKGGFLQVLGNRVILLADDALLPEEVDREEVERRRIDVEARLLSADVTPEERKKWIDERGWLAAQQAL